VRDYVGDLGKLKLQLSQQQEHFEATLKIIDLDDKYNKLLYDANEFHKINIARLIIEIKDLEENNAEYFV